MDEFGFRTLYRIDRDYKIVSVGDGWDAFACGNDAPELADGTVIGRSLWDFIADPSTRQIYRELIDKACGGQALSFDLRCDGPECRRALRMTISPSGTDGVEFEVRTIKIEDRPPQDILRKGNSSPKGLITSCSWCNRIKTARDIWDEIEDAVNNLHFFELEHPPSISHGICPDCSKRVTALYDGA